MVDPGLVLGSAGLAIQVVDLCIRGFDLLKKARNLGQDATYLMIRLEFEEERFVNWAAFVGLLNEPQPQIDLKLNVALVEKLMLQLEELLKDPAQTLRKRYGLEFSTDTPVGWSAPDNQPVEPQDGDSDGSIQRILGTLSKAISPRMREMVADSRKRMQKHSGLPKRLYWAAVDKKKLEEFVSDIHNIVGGLCDLLSDVQRNNIQHVLNLILNRVVLSCNQLIELNDIHRALEQQQEEHSDQVLGQLELTTALKALRLKQSTAAPEAPERNLPPADP